MTEKLSNEPEINEVEDKQNQGFVWVIDDQKMSQALTEGLVRLAKRKTNSDDQFSFYQDGELALTDYEKLIKEKSKLPDTILMDYTLFGGDVSAPKYQTGEEVIRALKEIAEKYDIALPQIIAFSNSMLSNDKLLKAGASRAIDKGNNDALREFLLEYMKEKKQEEQS